MINQPVSYDIVYKTCLPLAFVLERMYIYPGKFTPFQIKWLMVYMVAAWTMVGKASEEVRFACVKVLWVYFGICHWGSFVFFSLAKIINNRLNERNNTGPVAITVATVSKRLALGATKDTAFFCNPYATLSCPIFFQGFGSAFFLRIRIRAKIFMRILGVSGGKGKNDFFSRFRWFLTTDA